MSNPAPGDLERVRAFVNTYDAEDGSDAVATPDALRAWLVEHALLEDSEKVTTADQRRAAEVREALRATLRTHHGEPDDPAAEAVLREASRRAQLELCFGGGDRCSLSPAASGVDGAIGRLLAIIHHADRAGDFARLKVCPADDCQWAFFDKSRNRSAVWCDMKVCGNRHKVREYRERTLERAKG